MCVARISLLLMKSIEFVFLKEATYI